MWIPGETLKGPGLAVSRAFGDYYLKDFGLTSEPDIMQLNITPQDQFIILATDGVSSPSVLYFQEITNLKVLMS